MSRASLCALVLLVGGLVGGAATGCHKDVAPPPMHPKDGELPPLPPSSGTPVGYLIDNAGPLQLRDDQLAQLKDIDKSLAAKDDEIDTQLRIIEKPAEDPEQPKGAPPPHHNNAPGAQIRTTPDAEKLHKARSENDFEAIKKAFAVLDADQKTTARRLLEERGVLIPRGDKPAAKRDLDQ
jgi:hypothetical protein